MLDARKLGLGVLELHPRVHGDSRGQFAETWNREIWSSAGVDIEWTQDNHVRSDARGTLRGLHLQVSPGAQAKLVRAVRGAVWDVAVDLRPASPTRARWVAAVLDAERWNQLFIPAGFAHGYVTLTDGAEVAYKVSAPYAPTLERTVAAADPALEIAWPIPAECWIMSDRDRAAPSLADADLGAAQ